MIQSWFFILIGVLTLGAAFEFWSHGNVKMVLISICYAAADFVLATVKQ